jgi:hypothetical protein
MHRLSGFYLPNNLARTSPKYLHEPSVVAIAKLITVPDIAAPMAFL